jgi:hypothetical protein
MMTLIKAVLAVFVIVIFFRVSSVNAHESHTHTAPWQACEDKQKADLCSYTNGDGDLFKGTCQLFNEVLMCVRNQPIIHVKDLVKDTQSTDEKSHQHETLSDNGVH